jgi:hypothetical protein
MYTGSIFSGVEVVSDDPNPKTPINIPIKQAAMREGMITLIG